MKKPAFVVALLLALPAQAITIEGTVTGNNHSCSLDGRCSLDVKTAAGKRYSVIYGQDGQVEGCPLGGTFNDRIWPLAEGQKVRVRAPDQFRESLKDGSESYILCDKASSLEVLP